MFLIQLLGRPSAKVYTNGRKIDFTESPFIQPKALAAAAVEGQSTTPAIDIATVPDQVCLF